MNEFQKFQNHEAEKSAEHLKEWGARFRDALETVGFDEVQVGGRVDVEMVLMFIGDERLYGELSGAEKEIVIRTLENLLGFTYEDSEVIRSYLMKATGGEANEGTDICVDVFRTNEDEMFVRRYRYSDGEIRWSLGPKFLEDEEE